MLAAAWQLTCPEARDVQSCCLFDIQQLAKLRHGILQHNILQSQYVMLQQHFVQSVMAAALKMP